MLQNISYFKNSFLMVSSVFLASLKFLPEHHRCLGLGYTWRIPTYGVTQTFFFKLIFIGVELLYDVLVSTIQQSELAIPIHTSPVFWISYHLGHHGAPKGFRGGTSGKEPS